VQSLLPVPPVMGDSMRRFLVLRENRAIALLILATLLLDALTVVAVLAK
jgi:hypothetical protein